MDLLGGLLISFAAVPEAEKPEEEISSAINYIMSRRDYVDRVRKSNLLGFTFLPPYNGRWQPRPMNTLDRFLNGDWRKCSWKEYAHKDKTHNFTLDKNPGSRKVIFKRRLTLAFISAILADIALSFIIWLLIMMGFSFFGLGGKLGSQIDPLTLLVGSSVILFILLFWGFFVFIKPKKFKL
ncbi:MAG: hypothetical protein JSW26_01365 [Desulfobacterales bacterium]|nr:MAG: hypothetical protein JSW26_01365 [Desulfobacterales bacterium]